MKKIIALMLALMMIVPMFTVMASADVTLPDESTLVTGKGDADYVNDAAYSDWEAVGTAAEFKAIKAGGKYYLTADIDLTAEGVDFTTLKVKSSAIFFDGCGYTITTNKPLIAELAKGSEFKNLVIDGEISIATAELTAYGNGVAAGSLVGKVNGGTFTNILNKASITQTDAGSVRIGGIIGSAFNGSVVIENCINYGTIKATSTTSKNSTYGVGGIIGYAGIVIKSCTLEIMNCINYGTVINEGIASNYAYTGGIVGVTHKDIIGVVITDSINYGQVLSVKGTPEQILGHNNADESKVTINNVLSKGWAGDTAYVDKNHEDGITLPNGDTLKFNTIAPTEADLAEGGKYEGYVAIGTAEDFRDKVVDGGTYYLTADINLTEITGTAFAPLNPRRADNTDGKIILYGNGHTITTNVPIFANLGNGSYVSDLCIEGTIKGLYNFVEQGHPSSYMEGGRCTGALVGIIRKVTIKNIINYATIDASQTADGTKISANKNYVVGGIIGAIYSTAGSVIENCVNIGNVTGTVTSNATGVGGIVGRNSASSTINNCLNIGTVENKSTTDAYAGGIVGATPVAMTIKYAVNTGKVSSGSYAAGIVGVATKAATISYAHNAGTLDGTAAIGGIIGYSTSTTSPIKYVVNSANLSDSVDYAGGITGYVEVGVSVSNAINLGTITNTKDDCYASGISASLTLGGTITNSVNLGKVEAKNAAGGILAILGNATAAATAAVTINNSMNFAEINGLDAGGIIGYAPFDTTVTGSINNGIITSTGTGKTGGIIGHATAAATITDSDNAGTVTSSGSYAGGIIGCIEADAQISKCTNSAPVTGISLVGGIIGCFKTGTTLIVSDCTNKKTATITNQTASNGASTGGIVADITSSATTCKFENCINEASVYGYSRIGGIVGQPLAAGATFTDCVNSGNIYSCSGSGGYRFAGGIIGATTKTFTVTRCINTGEVFSNDTAGGIVGYVSGGVNTVISYSLNTGNIIVDDVNLDGTDCTRAPSRLGAGGITGNLLNKNITIKYCGVTGTITNASAATSSYTAGTAGIIAYTSGAPTVVNCFFAGELVGTEDSIVSGVSDDTAAALAAQNYVYAPDADQVKGGYLAYKMQEAVDTADKAALEAAIKAAVDAALAEDPNADTATVEAKVKADFVYAGLVWGQTLGTDPHPILNGEKVTKAGERYYNAYITDRKLALNESFSYTIIAKAPEGSTMVFTLNNVKTPVNGKATDTEGIYEFTFDGIAPQFINTLITSELCINENAADSKEETILDYCHKVYTFETATDKDKAIVEKVYLYGKAARDYVVDAKNLYTEAQLPAVTSEIFKDVVTGEVPAYDGALISGEANGASFYSANVFFDSTNSIILKVNIADGVDPATVKVNGKTVSAPVDGVSTVRFDDIFASAYAEPTEYKLTIDDVAGEQVLTYSVNIYAQRMAKKDGASDEMKALAAATYEYGVAANAYADANK